MSQEVDLTTRLGRLELKNPVLVASGTFGYGREMAPYVRLDRLGGILPKSITKAPRKGNPPWRTVETSAGLLNAIGLDNDGVDYFLHHHLPYLAGSGTKIIASVAGSSVADFVEVSSRLADDGQVDALELNISCPNVSGGIDFAADPRLCCEVVSAVRAAVSLPVIAKLTPNVTSIAEIATAAQDGGADAISAINTVLAMAINWRERRPMLANVVGGLSGPAIKPIALRCVHQIARRVSIPIIGIGGIGTIDDAMEFFVAGASAIQIGTANYYDPTCSLKILDALPGALQEIGCPRLADAVGSLCLPTGATVGKAPSSH